jgi:hypothetical protein
MPKKQPRTAKTDYPRKPLGQCTASPICWIPQDDLLEECNCNAANPHPCTACMIASQQPKLDLDQPLPY